MLAYCSADDGHNYYHNIRTNVKSVWGDIRPSDQSKLAEFIQELSTITHLETILKTVDEFSKKFDMDAFDLNDVSGAMNAAMGISSQSNSSDPNALSLPKVSPQCWKHTMMTVTGLFGRKSWAIKSKSLITTLFLSLGYPLPLSVARRHRMPVRPSWYSPKTS